MSEKRNFETRQRNQIALEEKETIQHFFLITGENNKKRFFGLKGSFHRERKEIWEMCGSPALPCHRSLGPEIRDDGFCALLVQATHGGRKEGMVYELQGS